MGNKGVTLVEIVVSIVILAVLGVGIAATMAFVTGGSGRSTTGTYDIQATNYARQAIEELKNSVSANATTSAPLIANATSNPTADPAAFNRTYTVTNVGTTGLKMVEVTVSYDDGK